MGRVLPVILALLVVSAIASAQQPARPSCTSAEYRQFDFWVGDWEVTDSAGTTVFGTNRVASEEGRCLVHENWVGSRGGTGQSLNFFDPLKQQWEQVWVGSDGLVVQISGGLRGASMVLEGEAMGQGGENGPLDPGHRPGHRLGEEFPEVRPACRSGNVDDTLDAAGTQQKQRFGSTRSVL